MQVDWPEHCRALQPFQEQGVKTLASSLALDFYITKLFGVCKLNNLSLDTESIMGFTSNSPFA